MAGGSIYGMGRISLRQRRLLARGIGPRAARRWSGAPFLSLGVGNRAALTLGTGNAKVATFVRAPGTAGNAYTLRIVVAGNNTAASVAVAGTAITFNSATNGSGVATSTAKDLRNAINFSPVASPLVRSYLPAGSDGSGTVAAVGATSFAGAA